MTNYEIMFIVKPDLEEATIKKEAENLKKVLTDAKCKINEEKAMGQKELAYEIKKFTEGIYLVFNFEAKPEFIRELERVYRITDEVLKYMTIDR